MSFVGEASTGDYAVLVYLGDVSVSAGIDQSLRIWNLQTGKLIRSLDQHTAAVHALGLCPNNEGLPMVASAAADRTIRFWQPTIGPVVRYVRLKAAPLEIAWSRDGSRIFSACTDGQLRVIDPVEVQVTQTLPALQGWAYSLALHPTDGSIAVGGPNGQIRRVIPKPK